ncbi:hypothetical protein RclHR1_00700022 [Rhizophagus clarus]|uniref:Uncharacterized protein n=1 Tax=Rhizophagus clarus TaxID=94130 RepID=A0A2Z6S116_9GLOM|nr:hypothetical protein RclHR1_00700022 [Rhizophagus clarus]GES99829.1 hypothetical protein GLOIN_2v1545022 [Rhizophagus clarus]
MVRYYKKDSIDLKNSRPLIWKYWIMIGFILTFGFVNVNAEQRCCYSTSSQMSSTSVNTYKLNITASHVDSEKAGNLYYVAISFEPGYNVIGDPYSPFSKVTCTLTPGTTIPQYNCQSSDTKMFFIEFDLSIQPPPAPNSTITASSVYIFSDKCQNLAFCTNLAENHDSGDSDKVSLGPLGTWPKYAVIIGGVILGLTLVIACYLVYKRNRPDDRYRDTSITPGTTYNDKNRIFSPNSLLRNGDDDDDSPPSHEPPKNTLIQFGNVTTHSPERSKSVKNRDHQSTTLTKSPTKKKKEKNHHEIADDGDKIPSVIIEMTNNNHNNGNENLERSRSHKSRRSNNSKDNNNTNRSSGYSTSDMSKTISNNDISDFELSDNNNDKEFYSSNTKKHSTSLHRSKSKLRNSVEESRSRLNSVEESRSKLRNSVEESRNDRRSSNNNHNNSNNHKPQGRSTLKRVEEDRDGHKIDRTTSRRHRSHSRSRKNSSPPPPASKSTSDLQKSLSTRTRQTDRDLNKKSFSNDREVGKNNNVPSRSSSNLDKKKSIKRHKDLISNDDTESINSSDIPLGDRLPLAMLVSKMPQSNSQKSDKEVVEDDDTTPLGRIATSTLSQSKSSNKQSLENDINDLNELYDSILNEVMEITDNKNTEEDKISDDDYPIGKSLSNINKEKESGTFNDEEIPIGQLRSG